MASDASLQRVLGFNREIAALASTGLPVDLGTRGGSISIADELSGIHVALTARVGQGESLEQAVDQVPLPSRYRIALKTLLRTGDPTIGLEAIVAPAEIRQRFGRTITQSMVYPLIVLLLTCVGFVYLGNVTLPKIEMMYAQLWKEPSDSVWFLSRVRDAAPPWWTLILAVLMIALVARRWWGGSPWAWLPGSRAYFDAMQHAHLSHQLATLMESGCSLEQSLELARSSAAQDAAAGAGLEEGLPPLLRWAVSGDLGGQPTSEVLRFVAATYRQSARRQQKIWRIVASTACGVVIGGGLVLLYGLSLFLPVAQLLKDVALPAGS